MKKIIPCFTFVLLMLPMAVSAYQVEPGSSINPIPDAQGNIVCSGQYTTKYNPEKLNVIMYSLSDSTLVTEDTELAKCMDDGTVRLDYRPAFAEGSFIEFARIYGTATANTATNKIDIAGGSLMPLEFPTDLRVLSPLSIMGDSITLQFVKDAQQKTKPMFRVSSDGAYEMGNIFFGCLKTDESGRQLSCAMSGQLYKENDAEGYVTIAGSGFVSESAVDETYDMAEAYATEHPNNIEELRDKAGLQPEDNFAAIPLADLNEIKVILPNPRNTDTLNLQAKARAEASSIDSFRVKSGKEIVINDFIENYKPQVFYSGGVDGRVEITGKDDVKIIASPERLKQGKPFLIALAPNPDANNAKVSVFTAGSKLAETNSEVYVFPESAEESYGLINFDYATSSNSILLKPGSKEMEIYSVDSMLDVTLLAGYNTVTITPLLENGLMEGSVKVTNPNNNMWILYADNELTWTPGKTIQQLGFNFNVNLNPAMGDAEMLSCTTDGICQLGNTIVISSSGLNEAKLREGIGIARERRFEEGTKAVSALSCSSDRDCDAAQRCLRRICVEEETECLDTRDCVRGEICDRGVCVTPEEALGAKTIEEEAQEMELKCERCGEGAGNICDREECESLGSCYFKEGKATNIFSGENVWNECHAIISTTPRQVSGEEFEEVFGTKTAAGCDSIEDCPEGRYCDLSMDEPECKRLGRMPCSEEEPCVAGLYCDAGRCRDVRGVSCENNEECPENYACDAELKRCTMPAGQTSFGIELGAKEGWWDATMLYAGILKDNILGMLNIEREAITNKPVRQLLGSR
ncbi:MAG: hypothetical protein KJ955_00720 [Nanoarchaeota archaeon]|nr:hypothetical protein [Nanoarchaeota archaeon]